MYAIKFKNKRLFYIDQTKLPLKELWRECKGVAQGYRAIKQLQVRGAPLIGVFAAYCVYIGVKGFGTNDCAYFIKQTKKIIHYLKSCRPTAINLAWALGRLESVLDKHKNTEVAKIKKIILDEANAIYRQDLQLCKRMAIFGCDFIKNGDTILTHCNAGFLATAGEGTALAVIYEAVKKFKNITVYADETRPLLQGSRLTAWELTKRGIDVTLICDNMAAYLMQQGKITKIFVGADRVTANGDIANKIGTYNVAVCAKYHNIPFYVVAPFSTFDLSLDCGAKIPIEERNHNEIKVILNKLKVAPKNVKAYNPAFDVTPNELISAIITDRGIVFPPYRASIKKLFLSR